MNLDDDTFTAVLVGWIVIITIVLGILLPYTINIPTLPALFYKTMTERSVGASPNSVSVGVSGANNPFGLLVHYDFEDGLTGRSHIVYDRSGSQYNAVTNGIFIGEGTGIVGNRSVLLPGTGYLYCSPDPAGGRTNVSFSLWFTVPDSTHNYRLAGAIAGSGSPAGWALGSKGSDLWDEEGNPIRLLTTTRSTGSLPFTEWNHKVLVYNGTHVTEYLNGFTFSQYQASGKPLAPGDGMTIGSWQPFGQNYAGRIDEFRIYDHALNETEIAGLYERTA